MADFDNSKSESKRKEDKIIYEQTNPSFHGTPEDSKNYKSLQNNTSSTNKKLMFTLKPSLLTQKAEQIRTDKATVSANTNISTNKFLVLGDNSKDMTSIQNSDQPVETKVKEPSTGFVFGENIFARVVQLESAKTCEGSVKEFKDLVCSNNNVESNAEVGNDALRKNADEHSQKQVTQQYEEAEVITGEEEETSVLKTLCKLFLFNPEKNEWIENGFCNLHLNDMYENKDSSKIKSRLVVRSKGGLKVLLNTSIWAEMGLARASAKAVRITAQSDEGIKSFLLSMQNSTDADSIFQALQNRKTKLARESVRKFDRLPERKREIIDSDDSEDAYSNVKKRIIDNNDTEDNEESSDA